MSKHQILNNIDHKNLRVSTNHAAHAANRIMCCLAIPGEFRDIQAEYAIFLHRDPETDNYLPMVMFGLERDENLYMDDTGWHAAYVPLMIERGPFLIGFQQHVSTGDGEKKMVVSIDRDDPRVNSDEGEPLFQPFGGNSAYTDRMVEVLGRIDRGQADIASFCQALDRHNLIEPFSLDYELPGGSKHQLTGFYTIHEERLAQLEGDVLAELSQAGVLQGAYMMIASLANIRRLIERKSARV